LRVLPGFVSRLGTRHHLSLLAPTGGGRYTPPPVRKLCVVLLPFAPASCGPAGPGGRAPSGTEAAPLSAYFGNFLPGSRPPLRMLPSAPSGTPCGPGDVHSSHCRTRQGRCAPGRTASGFVNSYVTTVLPGPFHGLRQRSRPSGGPARPPWDLTPAQRYGLDGMLRSRRKSGGASGAYLVALPSVTREPHPAYLLGSRKKGEKNPVCRGIWRGSRIT